MVSFYAARVAWRRLGSVTLPYPSRGFFFFSLFPALPAMLTRAGALLDELWEMATAAAAAAAAVCLVAQVAQCAERQRIHSR